MDPSLALEPERLAVAFPQPLAAQHVRDLRLLCPDQYHMALVGSSFELFEAYGGPRPGLGLHRRHFCVLQATDLAKQLYQVDFRIATFPNRLRAAWRRAWRRKRCDQHGVALQYFRLPRIYRFVYHRSVPSQALGRSVPLHVALLRPPCPSPFWPPWPQPFWLRVELRSCSRTCRSCSCSCSNLVRFLM